MSFPTKRLRYLAVVNPPVPADIRSDTSRERRLLRMEDIGEFSGVDVGVRRPTGELLTGYSFLASGDVAYAKVTPCFENGKGLQAGVIDGPTFATTELTVLRPTDDADARYLGWVLQSSVFRAPAIAAMTGAGGLRRVPESVARDVPVPAPALGVQRQIADYLDHETAEIDAFIADLDSAMQLTSEHRQAAIDRSMSKGDPRPLRRALETSITGPFGTVLSANEYIEGGVPIVNPVNIRANRIVVDPAASVSISKAEELSRYRLRRGDVLLARKGDVAKAALVGLDESGFVCGSDALALRPNRDTQPEFLWWQLQTLGLRQQLEAWSVGSTVAGLNQDIMAKVVIRIPARAEQAAAVDLVANTVALHEDELADIDAAISLAKERRAALISAAVTGQIDVTARRKPAVDSIQTALEEVR